MKTYVPRAHEVKNQGVIAKRTSQIGQKIMTGLDADLL